MLTSKQRAALSGMANDLNPVVFLGKAGAADGVYEALDKALTDHELIKLRFVDFKGERKELAHLNQMITEVLPVSRANRTDEVRAMLAKIDPQSVKFVESIEAHMHYNNKLGEAKIADAVAVKDRATWIAFGVLAIASIALLGISISTIRSINSRLTQVKGDEINHRGILR